MQLDLLANKLEIIGTECALIDRICYAISRHVTFDRREIESTTVASKLSSGARQSRAEKATFDADKRRIVKKKMSIVWNTSIGWFQLNVRVKCSYVAWKKATCRWNHTISCSNNDFTRIKYPTNTRPAFHLPCVPGIGCGRVGEKKLNLTRQFHTSRCNYFSLELMFPSTTSLLSGLDVHVFSSAALPTIIRHWIAADH